VFASDVEGQFDIFVMSSQGGKPRNLTSHPAFDHVPIYSRDGRWIYFSSTRSGEYQIWKVPAPGGEPIPVTKEGGWTSQESIDGSFLYYSPPPRGGPATVWRMAVTGSPPVKILDGVVNYSFAILEEGAYFMTQPANGMALQYLDFSTGRSRTIAGSLGERSAGGGFAISPDGRMILWR
jgi:hypothetical protein